MYFACIKTGKKTAFKINFYMFSLHYVFSGLGETRSLFKIISFPNISQACIRGPHPLNPFPRLYWQASMVQHFFLHHFDFIVHVFFLPLLPLPGTHYLNQKGEERGANPLGGTMLPAIFQGLKL